MSIRKISIFKLGFDEQFKKEFLTGCENILNDAFLTNHHYVADFENKLRRFLDSEYCLAVSNGTSALELSLRAIPVQGKEVLLPTNTFIATYVAVKNAGGIPVLLDIEANGNLGLCTEELSQKIHSGVGAVIAVHIGGLLSPSLEEVLRLCQENSVPLIEDASQAFGSTWNGVKAGLIGDCGSFSFFTTKVMTTGEGGAVFFKDQKLYEKAFSLRQFGMDPENSISHLHEGGNFKMTEFSALMGVLELGRVGARIEKRKLLADRYIQNLDGSDWKTVTPAKGIECSHYKMIVLPPPGIDRKTVIEKLNSESISLTGGVYSLPLHRQPVVLREQSEKGFVASFPVADSFCIHHFCPWINII